MLSRRRLFGRRLRVVHFIGLYQSDYCDFIVDESRPDALRLMLEWLADNPQAWDALDLRNLESGSATLQLVAEFFAARGHLVDLRHWNQAPIYMFGDAAADRELLKKKSLRRHYNYFCRQGRLEFQHYTAAEDIVGHLEGFFQQHVERWGRTETPSQFLQEAPRAFVREIVRAWHRPAICASRWCRWMAGRSRSISASNATAGSSGTSRPSTSRSARHSPGEVLIKYLLEDACARGLLEFDFGPGEEAFKYRFSNYARSISSVHVYRSRVAGRLDALAVQAPHRGQALADAQAARLAPARPLVRPHLVLTPAPPSGGRACRWRSRAKV